MINSYFHNTLRRVSFCACLLASFSQPLVAEVIEADYFRTILQSSSDPSGLYPAEQAMDGSTATYSLTDNIPNSYWQTTLRRSRPITRIEITNRTGTPHLEKGGQTLRIYDIDDQSVYSTPVTNPGSGGTWSVNLPAGTRGRIIRFGLEGGSQNAAGNYRSGLAEIAITCDEDLFISPTSNAWNNVALGATSYMVRLAESATLAEYGNDGNLATEAVTTDRTVDGYWEVDLGEPYAIYGIQSIAADGPGDWGKDKIICWIVDHALGPSRAVPLVHFRYCQIWLCTICPTKNGSETRSHSNL